ncbi:hypothetical protein HYDPIDRAFT_24960 [Hydnomerulius pinastri MD-312]|nr:hypothetical protein HYDPIDRAFT_24960 [Hydnomerulius pinastri MD-312]
MAERSVGRPWTSQEDELLAHAVARWLHSLSPSVKKTAWTPEEDNLLLELLKIHSTKWAVIARNIPGRTDDACSKRYREALDPSLKKDEWTPEEDEKLVDAYKRLGGKWGQVGQELQRSGLGCRNRWRLLERKRTTAPLSELQGAPTSKTTPSTPPGPPSTSLDYSWSPVSMIGSTPYWDPLLSQEDAPPSASLSGPHLSHVRSRNGVDLVGEPPPAMRHAQSIPQVGDFPAPTFHYSSSSLSSALSSPHLHGARYEKSTAATACIERQSQFGATESVPPDSTAAAVFVHFASSSSANLPSSSTSPVPLPANYSQDVHRRPMYEDCSRQFDQLQRSVPHMSVPIHTPAPVHPVRADYYSAPVGHEERSLSHAAMMNRRQSAARSNSLRARGFTGAYFTPSQDSEQQGSHVSSPMPSGLAGPVLGRSEVYYQLPPQPQLDVNVDHVLLPASDPLSLSKPHSGYHYSPHQHDSPRARALETPHGQEHHGEYYDAHVQSAQRDVHPLSRPPTTAPPEAHYLPQQSDHVVHHTPASTPQPEPGPSRETADQYYASPSVQSSQLVHRTSILPKAMGGVPYVKRPLPLGGSSTNPDELNSSLSRPASRQRAQPNVPRKRPDTQAPLRLSSDLPATPDPSIKPYVCGHESCWPANALASCACYCTSRGLSDHNKSAHPDDSGGDRPYRCGLEGCGKSWKSINGLQYHLQISKAHFQHAITSTYVTSYIAGLSVPASVEASTTEGDDKTKKQYSCPHQDCPNRYKQLSGLRYHLAHGHPPELPAQLDLVPPALSRKLAEKMRSQGSAPSSSEHQFTVGTVGPAAPLHPISGSNVTLPTL